MASCQQILDKRYVLRADPAALHATHHIYPMPADTALYNNRLISSAIASISCSKQPAAKIDGSS
jgi:hypothetical protein